VEAAVLDPQNPYVLAPHLAAAAAELPLTAADAQVFGPTMLALVEVLVARGLLRRRPGGWFWTRPERATDHVSLRGTGETVRIVRRPGEQWGRDHTDTARLAAVTGTAANTLEDVVADIRRLVRRSVETLSGLSDADLSVEAASMNPRWGLKPASFVVDQLLVHHAEKHLGQIRRNVTQFAEAHMKPQE